ncbi:MAG: zinc-dependent metalloprotease [Bacteroidota bacterium]
MNKKVLHLSFFLLLAAQISFAQFKFCGQKAAMHQLSEKYPGYQRAVQQTFDDAKLAYQSTAQSRSQQVHKVQVVVHVVYNTEVQNISDELIQEQIDVLNEDFRRLNPDAVNAREMYQAIGADAGIEFELATVDPDGNPTNGITRTQTEVESFVNLDLDLGKILEATAECGLDFVCIQEKILVGGLEDNIESGGVQMDDVKRSNRGGIDPWDTERYINIWVTNLNIDLLGQEVPMILGFAYPPVGAPNWPDEIFEEDLASIAGLVIHHEAWGKSNAGDGLIGSLADGGRTTTHEMGHYFGLRHVHGDGDCDADDGISDTPAADANQQAQPDPNSAPVCEELHTINTCDSDDMPDMIENYMDYNAISCQNLFTVEQVGIMRAMLEGPRVGLIGGQVSTSVESELATKALTVFPNPTANTLNIDLEGYKLEDFAVRVQTILGAAADVIISNNNRQIDMSDLASGVYLVTLVKDDLQLTKKVSVLK